MEVDCVVCEGRGDGGLSSRLLIVGNVHCLFSFGPCNSCACLFDILSLMRYFKKIENLRK